MIISGLKAWVVQRLTAVYLAVFTLWLALNLLFHPPGHYRQWVQWFSDPFVQLAFLLFFVSLMFHAWVGVRDVIMDYIHSMAIRSLLLSAVLLVLLALAFWSLMVVLNLGHT